MRCKVCGNIMNGKVAVCSCGYCKECLDRYGHEECERIEEEDKDDNCFCSSMFEISDPDLR